jgi:hypothetical protein
MMPRAPRHWLAVLCAMFSVLVAPFRGSMAPLRLPRRSISAFAPMAVLPLHVRTPLPDLVRAARDRGTTVGTLLLSAFAVAFRRLGSSTERPDALVRARVSIDLRDYFPPGRRPGDGNYVSSFTVDVQPSARLDMTIPAADLAMRRAVERFRRRAMVLAGLLMGLQTRIGRKLFGRFVLSAKLRDRLPRQSLHFSNLGRVPSLEHGAVRIDAVLPSLTHHDFYIGVLGLGDRLHLTASFPSGEIDTDTVRALLDAVDRILAGAVRVDEVTRAIEPTRAA